MGVSMRLTHDSLATMIAWVSTCLVASGMSVLYSESIRFDWLMWGCFGLASAVGLDIVARAQSRARSEELTQVATARLERDVQFMSEENQSTKGIGEAVARMLAYNPRGQSVENARRSDPRYPCDLMVELLFHPGRKDTASESKSKCRIARITNLSKFGFELTLTSDIPHQRMMMNVTTATGGRETLLGEVLWSGPKPDGSYVAGGRFLNFMPTAASGQCTKAT